MRLAKTSSSGQRLSNHLPAIVIFCEHNAPFEDKRQINSNEEDTLLTTHTKSSYNGVTPSGSSYTGLSLVFFVRGSFSSRVPI